MKENILITLKSLKGMSEASPSSTFKRNSRARFIERINQETSLVLPKRSISTRWAYSFAFAAILLFFTGSTVFAAQSSLPSDPLYPVKVASEKVALALSSPIPSLKSIIAEELVKRRENEYKELEKNNRQDLLEKAYDSYQKSLKDAKGVGSTKNENVLRPNSQLKQEKSSPDKKITPTDAPNTPKSNRGNTQKSVTETTKENQKDGVGSSGNSQKPQDSNSNSKSNK
ncbi:MAG: hypothetical protein A3D24_01385 [Candidatus Blackburnbacteria bacterium RIFCSPHIGHO2_02_FULL_39_13]|uniref:DUF5667 domain-containing protein n=1 Tax=Candidatus Blackburnbacteria bacterium RIFCSPLOWO2_01_FULL_40_20 TaxID=1797519 RepID=A0A1G1VFH9_9BACT|nr:MAG: hypothetical protein UT38_C0006G0019 [Microgenomates group bacterium GW2011_GWA2_39_19]OGY06782.1 MAG: hypothetical protein A2694_00490 [Candidatus Blackburnbacteria bacterium RIFCSPHIGHO2_01_FULL_40_17]OGY09797.1 MAG: hypothetical protein A3D24_01385 [Candidatus Blackburnbacteria bacterium RIFCSPHIGHO2_02_FULL_39_13]OGY14077.1 MAG: hypothetical protein A3A77_03830 [Candidatus Blackburnbacteria bacterium RIFCSPLOWO2_01_FULL_40_20]HBL52279.1 hypothetical protein [Candidatus Blackburnbact